MAAGLAIVVSLSFPALGAQQHPALPDSVTTRDCLQCHSDHVKGQEVHAATVQCGSCHRVVVEGSSTSILLTKSGSDLCFTCHQRAKEKTVHGPYRAGACIGCHEPHRSDQAKLLRAPASTLCSGCHVIDYRGTKIDYANKSVTLPSKKTISKAEYDEIPKIELDEGGLTGHPVPIHPVTGMNSRGTGQITCLTCHHQHAADTANLVRTSAKGTSICTTCHPGMG